MAFSDSKIPEKDGLKKKLLSDVDYEIEYQLQVKPKSHQLGSQSQGIAEVEIVAVAINYSENCENVESSVTIFVNNGYKDVEKSIHTATDESTTPPNNIDTQCEDINEL